MESTNSVVESCLSCSLIEAVGKRRGGEEEERLVVFEWWLASGRWEGRDL